MKTVISFVLSVCLAASAWAGPQSDDQKNQHVQAGPTMEALRQMEQEKQLKAQMAEQDVLDDHLKQLVWIAQQAAEGIPYAKKLVAEFENRAVIFAVQPGGTTVRHFIGKDAEELMKGGKPREQTPVIIATPDQASWLRHRPPQPFSFAKNEFLFIPAGNWNQRFLGAVVLHEMVHWDDQYLSRRESMASTGKEWLLGEARAYALELEVLDHWSKGAMSRGIRRILADPSKTMPIKGTRFFGWNRGVSQEIAGLWPEPALGQQEQAHRDGFFTMAFLLLQARNDDERAEAVRITSVLMARTR